MEFLEGEKKDHRNTHYSVSGGPMMVTLHSKMFESSTSPAENPSTGFLVRSRART